MVKKMQEEGLIVHLEAKPRALMRFHEMGGRAGCKNVAHLIGKAQSTAAMIIRSILHDGWICCLVSRDGSYTKDFCYLETFRLAEYFKLPETDSATEIATAGIAVHPHPVSAGTLRNSKIFSIRYTAEYVADMHVLKAELADVGVYTNIPQITRASIQTLDAMYHFLDKGEPLQLWKDGVGKEFFLDMGRRAA